MTTAEILATARTLPSQEQLFLNLQMLDEADAAVQSAWVAEAKNRLAAFDQGEIQAAPIEELLAKMRAI